MTIHCEDCLAYYPEGYNHVCPPWLKELVRLNKIKKKGGEKWTHKQKNTKS